MIRALCLLLLLAGCGVKALPRPPEGSEEAPPRATAPESPDLEPAPSGALPPPAPEPPDCPGCTP